MADTRKNVLDNENPAHTFLQISNRFRAANPEEREIIRAQWDCSSNGSPWTTTDDQYHFEIPRYFQQLQQEQPNFDISQWIEAAVSSLAIQGVVEDFRDGLGSICLIYHTALQAHINVTKVFSDATELSTGEMAKLFGSWLGRKPDDKSLYAFGFRKAPHYDGIAYEWIGTSEIWEKLKPIKLDKWGQIIVASPADAEQIRVQDAEQEIKDKQSKTLIQDHSYDSWIMKMHEQALSKARKIQKSD